MSRSYYLAVAIPLMALLTLLQTAVLPRFPILGFIPLLPLLVVIAWGLLRSADEGILWALVAGFFLDLFSMSPLGSQSLAMMAAVAAVTLIRRPIPDSRFIVPALLTAVATFIYFTTYFILIRMAGFTVDSHLVQQIPQVAILNALLTLPLYWLVDRINRRLTPRRVEV